MLIHILFYIESNRPSITYSFALNPANLSLAIWILQVIVLFLHHTNFNQYRLQKKTLKFDCLVSQTSHGQKVTSTHYSTIKLTPQILFALNKNNISFKFYFFLYKYRLLILNSCYQSYCLRKIYCQLNVFNLNNWLRPHWANSKQYLEYVCYSY